MYLDIISASTSLVKHSSSTDTSTQYSLLILIQHIAKLICLPLTNAILSNIEISILKCKNTHHTWYLKSNGDWQLLPQSIIKFYSILLLLPCIHHLFCASLHSTRILSLWHQHLITLIFKSWDGALIKHYRPSSLLCMLSKVLHRNNSL